MKIFLFLWLPLIAHGAFEAIDCEQESIFENPAHICKPAIQTLWVQSFGILPYTRVCYSNHFGLGVSNFGNELYRENEILLGYGWSGKSIEIGASIRGMSLWIKEYGTNYTIGLDFGGNFQATPNFKFNLVLHNLNFPEICHEELPKRAIFGFIANLSPDFVTKFQLYKESRYPAEIRIRNEVKFSPLLSLGVGIKTYPSSFSLGMMLNYKRFGISYFARTHPALGLTHILGVEMEGPENR